MQLDDKFDVDFIRNGIRMTQRRQSEREKRQPRHQQRWRRQLQQHTRITPPSIILITMTSFPVIVVSYYGDCLSTPKHQTQTLGGTSTFANAKQRTPQPKRCHVRETLSDHDHDIVVFIRENGRVNLNDLSSFTTRRDNKKKTNHCDDLSFSVVKFFPPRTIMIGENRLGSVWVFVVVSNVK